MPAYVFHLNMQNFGGGTIARNDAFDTALAAIGAATNPYYVVAGFTEIRNCRAAPTALGDIVTQLDAGLTTTCVIWCGVAAKARASDPDRHEYAAISWDRRFLAVDRVGHTYNSLDKWEERSIAGPAEGTHVLPAPSGIVTADKRGMVFVAGKQGGVARIFGFLHDMYTVNERGLLIAVIGPFIKAIRASLKEDGIAGYDDCRVHVGGDFNVEPRNPSKRYGLKALGARAGGAGNPYRKTTVAHAYDFWMVRSDSPLTDASCFVHTQARKDTGGPSDHAAIRLSY